MARNETIKTWISDSGEVFEGSQKELMQKFGIKHRQGFTRRGGAADAHGNRWKEESEFNATGIQKPALHLGDVVRYEKSFSVADQKWTYGPVIYCPSETANIYTIATAYTSEKDNEMNTENWAMCLELIKQIQTTYCIVDNRSSVKQRKVAKLSKQLSNASLEAKSLRMQRFFPNIHGEWTDEKQEMADIAEAKLAKLESEYKTLKDKVNNTEAKVRKLGSQLQFYNKLLNEGKKELVERMILKHGDPAEQIAELQEWLQAA